MYIFVITNSLFENLVKQNYYLKKKFKQNVCSTVYLQVYSYTYVLCMLYVFGNLVVELNQWKRQNEH